MAIDELTKEPTAKFAFHPRDYDFNVRAVSTFPPDLTSLSHPIWHSTGLDWPPLIFILKKGNI